MKEKPVLFISILYNNNNFFLAFFVHVSSGASKHKNLRPRSRCQCVNVNNFPIFRCIFASWLAIWVLRLSSTGLILGPFKDFLLLNQKTKSYHLASESPHVIRNKYSCIYMSSLFEGMCIVVFVEGRLITLNMLKCWVRTTNV